MWNSENQRSVVQHPAGKHRYASMVEGVSMAQDFIRSRLSVAEFSRQRGVSKRMVQYWVMRSRHLVAETRPQGTELVQVAEVSADGAIVAPVRSVAGSEMVAPGSPSAPPVASATPTIEVRLPNGVRIGVSAGFSPGVLSQVIACVGTVPC